LQALVDGDHEHLAPLVEYRELLVKLSADVSARMDESRTGQAVEFAGPFTFETRERLLAELLRVQAEVGVELITDAEVSFIRGQWAEDRSAAVQRRAHGLLTVLQGP